MDWSLSIPQPRTAISPTTEKHYCLECSILIAFFFFCYFHSSLLADNYNVHLKGAKGEPAKCGTDLLKRTS